jgi:DNA-binding MarR family transcriptional regulator
LTNCRAVTEKINKSKTWYEDVALPALLRHARNTYGVAMRCALDEAGYDDVPKNGLYVIGGLAKGEGAIPLGQLIQELRISKQAAGQLVDTLVTRGYLERAVDPEDRRKLTIMLSERGRAAAAAQTAGREKVDSALLARVGNDDFRRTKRTLAALIDIGAQWDGQPDD